MRFYKKKNVFEEALDRIRYLYDEFEEVSICVSGGKDSTVIFNLALIVAKEKNRLPLRVMFIDQEAEWTHTIDMIKKIMYRKDVEPMWFQMPLVILNATSGLQQWLECWKEGDEWIREKDQISIKENIYGTNRFKALFSHICNHHFKGKKHAYLNGVRTEESPSRYISLTTAKTYKWIT